MADITALPVDWIVTSGQFTRRDYTAVYPAIDPTKPENSLKGEVVAVTGASRGIGAQGIALAFVKADVKAIVLIATKADKLTSVEEELKKTNRDVEILSFAWA